MNVHDFTVADATGAPVSLSAYDGKVLLIVNTAIKCGLTPQYEGLEALYTKYKDRGFEILDFPCNQFWSRRREPLRKSANSARSPTAPRSPLWQGLRQRRRSRSAVRVAERAEAAGERRRGHRQIRGNGGAVYAGQWRRRHQMELQQVSHRARRHRHRPLQPRLQARCAGGRNRSGVGLTASPHWHSHRLRTCGSGKSPNMLTFFHWSK